MYWYIICQTASGISAHDTVWDLEDDMSLSWRQPCFCGPLKGEMDKQRLKNFTAG